MLQPKDPVQLGRQAELFRLTEKAGECRNRGPHDFREIGMKLGIVGLGRSGKTTIFNALTRRVGESVAPGGQMVPVPGVVPVPDERVEWLTDLYKPRKKIYAQVTYTDLQGLAGVADNKQEYMAQLIAHMRQVDAFLLVVRNFQDPALGKPDVARDLKELEEEFLISDLATIEKRIEKIAMEEKRGKKLQGPERELLDACSEVLNAEKPLRSRPDLADAPELRGFTFLSAKPLLVIVNNSDDDGELPPVSFESMEALVVRGKLEMEMAQLPESEAAVFQQDFGITESALARVIRRSFELLRLATFLTVGEDEVRAWTIKRDLPAAEAAGVVHSDIQRGFIRAEVVAYDDLKKSGDYAAARKLGLVRLEGKTYRVQDGDIMLFRFNV